MLNEQTLQELKRLANSPALRSGDTRTMVEAYSIRDLIAEIERLRAAAEAPVVASAELKTKLEGIRAFIDEGIQYNQSSFDMPPEPASKWDFEAICVIGEIKAMIESLAAPASPAAPVAPTDMVPTRDGPDVPKAWAMAVYEGWRAQAGIGLDFAGFMGKYGTFLTLENIAGCWKHERGGPAMKAAIAALAAAPVAQPADERAQFEHAERASDLTRSEGPEEDYVNPFVQSAWEGWQARAALAATPAAPLAQQSEPVGEVVLQGVVGVKFYENCEYGTALPVGTRLYAGSAPASPVPSDAQTTEYLRMHLKLAGDYLMRARQLLGGQWNGALDDALNHVDCAAAKISAAPASTGPCSDDTAKDAERYRWLRDFGPEGKPPVMIDGRWYGAKLGNGVGLDLDQAIDAALSAAEQVGKHG